MKIAACLVISCVVALVKRGEGSMANSTLTLWSKGQIPYEISKQFISNDSTLIEQALIEIMKTTCIKFVPRTNEPDYVVFMKYKHPSQQRGTCWSGKWTNDGPGTIGNQKGRQIVSLWPDLDYCFNTLDIIREILNLLGLQTKSSLNPTNRVNKYGRQIMHSMYFNYEENLGQIQTSFLENSCKTDSKLIRNRGYALDMKELILASQRDSCRTLKQVNQINQMYGCYVDSASVEKSANVSSLASVSPNCNAEAKAGTCKSDPVYMSTVCDNLSPAYQSMCEGAAYLKNAHGKCLSSAADGSHDGNVLNQWDCEIPENGQLWSWNETNLGSGDRHLCNGHKKCVGSPYNSDASIDVVQWEYVNEEGQRFTFLYSATDGFYTIKNDHGKCLGIDNNSQDNTAVARVMDCNSSENGQRWKWHYVK